MEFIEQLLSTTDFVDAREVHMYFRKQAAEHSVDFGPVNEDYEGWLYPFVRSRGLCDGLMFHDKDGITPEGGQVFERVFVLEELCRLPGELGHAALKGLLSCGESTSRGRGDALAYALVTFDERVEHLRAK